MKFTIRKLPIEKQVFIAACIVLLMLTLNSMTDSAKHFAVAKEIRPSLIAYFNTSDSNLETGEVRFFPGTNQISVDVAVKTADQPKVFHVVLMEKTQYGWSVVKAVP